MNRMISLVLVFAMCLSLCACGNGASPTGENESSSKIASFPENVPMYTSGIVVKTNFGEITVVDAAFCGKAQLIDALPKPTYNSAGEGRIVFAMRTLISNTTDKDIVLFDDLKVSIQYGKDNTYGCSKGGNYTSSDPLYKILPAGTSGEYIICGRIPVETYHAYNQFYVEFNEEKLGFTYDDIQIYTSMGYQEGDNSATTIETVIESAGISPPNETEANNSKIDTIPEFSFSLEDSRIDSTKSTLKVEAKIRNDSDHHFVSAVFNGVILDANGDILENCGFIFSNGLEAGQAGWSYIPIRESATAEKMASIKLITMWYKDDPQAPSHNLRFDLSEPLVIDFSK